MGIEPPEMRGHLFTPARIVTRNFDLTKEWYVEYKYRNPETDKLQRFKETGSANYAPTVDRRLDILRQVQTKLNKQLNSGYNPFTKEISENFEPTYMSWEGCVPMIIRVQQQTTGARNADSYRGILKFFTEYLEWRQMHILYPTKISGEIIHNYLDFRLGRGDINSGTRNKDLVILRRSFNILKERGIIKSNPCDGIKKLKERPQMHEAYTKQELQNILAWLKENDPHMLSFCSLVCMAVRPSEILRLQVGDFDLEKGLIKIPNTKSKNGYSGTIGIQPNFEPYLERLELRKYPRHFYVFHPCGWPDKEQHTNRTYWSKRFEKVKKALGLSENHSMYSLKHSVLCMMAENGATLPQLMAYGRFQSLEALQAYLRKHMRQVPTDVSALIDLKFI